MPTKITKILINEDAGDVCPPGFTLGVKTRKGRHCYKLEKIPKTFDMSALMSSLDEATIIVESEDMEDLMGAFQKMNMAGGRTRKAKKSKRSNKKNTRKSL